MLAICIFLLIVVLIVLIARTQKLPVKLEKSSLAKDTGFNNLITSSYYINLDSAHERRRYMQSQFEEHGINPERFSALDKKLLNSQKINDLKSQNIIAKDFNPKEYNGSIACLVSHVNLWKRIYEEYERGTFLIFEDDCKILPGFKEKLNYYVARLPEKWDMVWLGYSKIKGKRYDDNLYVPEQGNNVGYNTQHHCYLVNYDAIPHIIKILLPLTRSFKNKDKKLRYNFDRFKAFFLRERLAVQDMEHFPTSDRTGRKNG